MFKPGAIETASGGHLFPCGHRFILTSNNARKRWTGSDRCPRCWAARPLIKVDICRVERWWGQRFDWFPGVRVHLDPQSAQGLATPTETVQAATLALDALLREFSLRHEDQRLPGLDLDNPATHDRLALFVERCRALGDVQIGGRHAARVGLV